MSQSRKGREVVGRGAQIEPHNRFESVQLEATSEGDESLLGDGSFEVRQKVPTHFLPDATKKIICENESPDIPFRYSINPYRGCEHGCAYCYARPSHEFLGMNAGLDFETRILVKHNAEHLLRNELNRSSYVCEPLSISGVTDCYQPAERKFKITRSLLEVLEEANHPVGIVTKNALVSRDLDILESLAAKKLVHVFLSITTLDSRLARQLEPRTATPEARLKTLSLLSDAGIPTGAMVAPVIPGLNDEEIPQILSSAEQAGAMCASYVLLRLPHSVEPVFLDWLNRNEPLKVSRVESLIRSTRAGKLNDGAFNSRMRGTGAYADLIKKSFNVFRNQYHLGRSLPRLETTLFRPPRSGSGQMQLF